MPKYPFLVRPLTLPPYWKDVTTSTSGEALNIADTMFVSGDILKEDDDSITKVPGNCITAIQIFTNK